jgi:hypothetical protein
MAKYKEISKSEYEGLYNELEKIQKEIYEYQRKYEETKTAIKYYKMFHDPEVIISETGKGTPLYKWMGRVHIHPEFISDPSLIGKRYYLNFNIIEGSKFKDKNDPNLIKLAKEMAIQTLNKKKFKDRVSENSFKDKKVIKITESELINIVKKIIN